ncbi:MAG: hypothetical protein DRJ47_04885 [Thermoprotei archaeon]|nr:MAG: hypothetical protein DRJ47_04885 [Thermoprotei archaeon]
MEKEDTRKLYNELLRKYNKWYPNGEEVLKRDLRYLEVKGFSREEALRELYKKTFKEGRQNLEDSLESLRGGSGAATFLFFLLFIAIILPVFFAAPPLAFFLFIVMMVFFMLFSAGSVEWSFSEVLRLEGSASLKNQLMKEVPFAFQEVVLEDVDSEMHDNVLTISIRSGKAVREQSGRSERIVYADLGLFKINASFQEENGDLLVKARYEGSPPRKYSDVAAELYEKYVVGFRVALRRASDKLKPKMVLKLDFMKLMNLLEEKGIIVKEVKCPRCGAPVKLPVEGGLVSCSYCGATFTAYDVYKIIRDNIKEIISLEPELGKE